jgi:hypothetical protein
MKTTLLLIIVSLACVLDAPAQGRINFNNTSATGIRITSNVDGSGSVLLGTASTAQFGFGPASVRIQLFAGLTSTSLSPVLVGPGANQLYVTNTASTLASAQGTFPGGNPLPLAGFDGSQPVFLQFTVRAIDASGPSGWVIAVSPTIQVNLSLFPALGTDVFSTTADASHWNGLTITPIPEPTVVALVGFCVLGASFRRLRS